jgi:hypothetical protein
MIAVVLQGPSPSLERDQAMPQPATSPMNSVEGSQSASIVAFGPARATVTGTPLSAD